MMSEAPRINYDTFLHLLNECLPDVASLISDIESGLLHPEMGVIAGATVRAIESQSWAVVDAHFWFIERIFANGDDAIRNAVYVSYLENVLLGESSDEFLKAKFILPPLLSQAFDELEIHFEKLSQARAATDQDAGAA
jgi:hypothetical protein